MVGHKTGLNTAALKKSSCSEAILSVQLIAIIFTVER